MTDTFNSPTIVTNIPELTVSALSSAIKNTVEDAFGYVRVKGELSKVTIAKSGHLYTSLKDDNAVLDAVCWKGTMMRLKVKPEEGLEVICTGRITTYPGRSNYQMVIENMEMAGIGAILKMLEALKSKLAAEGIFDPARKKPIPFLPRKIGIITSPTGAVIRDILHRLADRFPVEVTLWPVNVQGQTAAAEIIRAINGLNALQGNARPDVIIVARGGGSFEDLMPFNDEALVRAAASSQIPLISAVGHETDTTLIDYAADLRAPTPTAAAEMAVPVRAQLLALIQDCEARLNQSLQNRINNTAMRLDAYARTLANPARLLDTPTQRLDRATMAIVHGFEKRLNNYQTKLTERASRLRTPTDVIALKSQSLNTASDRLTRAAFNFTHFENKLNQRASRLRTPTDVIALKTQSLTASSDRLMRIGAKMFDTPEKQIATLSRVLESLSFKSVLARGYAVIRDEQGALVSSATALNAGQNVTITLHDGDRKAQINN